MRLRSVVLPEPEGPMSATKSPRGMSRVSPCRTSIVCRPRSYTLVTLRTWTINSDMMLPLGFVDSWLGLVHPGAVSEIGGPIDHHRLPRAHAREQLARFPAHTAECDRAPLQAMSLQDEHDILLTVLAQRSGRHQHSTCPLVRLACRLGGFEKGNAYPHVRYDAVVLDVEADAHLHGSLGAV